MILRITNNKGVSFDLYSEDIVEFQYLPETIEEEVTSESSGCRMSVQGLINDLKRGTSTMITKQNDTTA